MAVFWSVLVLVTFAAEPVEGDGLTATDAYVLDRQFLDDSAQLDIRPLVDVGRILDLLPEDVVKAGQNTQDRIRKVQDERNAQYFERQAKQLVVHLSTTQLKTFTANHPPKDRELFDKVLPSDELVICCDGMEQTGSDGKNMWKFVGNVRLHARQFFAICHEVTVSRDDENFYVAISGGRDLSEEPEHWQDSEYDLSRPGGTVLLATNRDVKAKGSYEAAMMFSAGQIRQKRTNGNFVLKVEPSLDKQNNCSERAAAE